MVVLIAAMLFVGCGNGEVETLKNTNRLLQDENKELRDQIDGLNIKVNMLKTDKENLTLKIDEISNGAEQRIVKIRQSMNDKKYDEVIKGANELHELFPGTNEDNEAQELLQQVNSQKEMEAEATEMRKQQEEAEKLKSAKDTVRNVITISSLYTENPNSAGGVSWDIVFTNTSDKEIKYASFTVVPYNAVGDVVTCSIRRTSEFTGKVTGPIKPGEQYGNGRYFDCAWYNNTIVRCELTEIRIEYIDGTYVSFDSDKSKLALL